MAIINPIKKVYRVSFFKVESIWDEEQWSEKYNLNNIPKKFQDEVFIRLNINIETIINRVKQIIPNNY